MQIKKSTRLRAHMAIRNRYAVLEGGCCCGEGGKQGHIRNPKGKRIDIE